MSDFDEEAERERLREKYEQDREKREATEQMSELLLQGATMTNAHCSECGDPIFRYEGQEFCATCERAVDRNGSAETDEQETDDSDSNEQGTVEVTTPDDDRRVVFGRDGENPPEAGDSTQSTRREQTTDRDPHHEAEPPARRDADPPAEQQTNDVPAKDNGTVGASAAGIGTAGAPEGDVEATRTPEGDVGAARAALTRTLVRFSERAEATDDPRRAREHLETAREAAATLAELRR